MHGFGGEGRDRNVLLDSNGVECLGSLNKKFIGFDLDLSVHEGCLNPPGKTRANLFAVRLHIIC